MHQTAGIAAEDLICKCAFCLLHFEDFLLNGVFRNELVYGNRPGLTDTVRAVCGLVLCGEIPPWVEMNHNIRAGQIQPRSACFQRNQKNRRVVLIETIDKIDSILFLVSPVILK